MIRGSWAREWTASIAWPPIDWHRYRIWRATVVTSAGDSTSKKKSTESRTSRNGVSIAARSLSIRLVRLKAEPDRSAGDSFVN